MGRWLGRNGRDRWNSGDVLGDGAPLAVALDGYPGALAGAIEILRRR